MKKLVATILLVLLYHTVPAQSSRVDSLSQLITIATDNNEKAKLLLLRSKAHPNTQIDKPMADAQQALAYYQQSKNGEGQVDAYLQVSAIYSRQSKYQLALDFDSTAYQLASQLNYKKGTALSLGNMGRNHQQLGNLKLAEKNCLQSLQLLKEAGLDNETADIHSRLGVIYRRLGDINKSLYHYDEGIEVAKKFNSQPILAVLYMNKANSLNEAARYDESVQMHLQSIRIKERIKDERGLMQSFNNIALVYMKTGEKGLSIENFRKANQLAKQFNNKTGLGYNFTNLATLYISLNQKDSVPYFFEQALAAFKETGEKPGLALVYHNYGNFLLESNELDRSQELLEKALETRKETKATYDIASTMNVLGALLTRKGKMREAEQYLLQSLAILKNENSSREKDAYKYLSDHYKKAGDYEEAFKYQAGYIGMQDTIVNENEVANILKAQSKYEVEKRDAQLVLANKEKEIQTILVGKKNQQLIFSGIGLALALLLSLVFFMNYRGKKKHAAALEAKNKQIETLIRELHHRVKNNLQVVSGLLSLQSSRLDDDKAKEAMDEGRTRVDAMAMIHQKLYMDNNLASVDILDYLNNLNHSLAQSFGYADRHVKTNVQLPESSLHIDTAIPIGLIVNELVTNAFKHAFAGVTDPQVTVSLQQVTDGTMELQVSDNGKGAINKGNSNSFGMKLVHTLVDQLNGSIKMKQDQGTIYSIQIRA